MIRRALTAIEVAATTIVLGAALPILAHAADYGVGHWAAPAFLAAVFAAAILTPVSMALLLIVAWQWGQRRRTRVVMPPSARTPLWTVPDADEFRQWDMAHPQPHQAAYDAVRSARCVPVGGRHSAPQDEWTDAELAEFADARSAP